MTNVFASETAFAIEAVQAASRACRAVQAALVTEQTIQKKDRSPVTVADFASQAIVCAQLAEAFPEDAMVAEEDSGQLQGDEHADARRSVVSHVGAVLGSSPSDQQVLAWIDHGASAGGGSERFWTLDPIDGTKGFLRRGQYAVALALIEAGEIVLGVLGCPNLAMETGGCGALLIAARGQGTRLLSLDGNGAEGTTARVSTRSAADGARFCESVESGHSDQGQSAAIAARLGITAEPVRMDSQAKYATVARGEASIYMRLPTRADYREKIWDHAAGVIVVEEAGGRVSDIHGKPLDFTHGRQLEQNAGVLATNGHLHDQVVGAIGATLSGA